MSHNYFLDLKTHIEHRLEALGQPQLAVGIGQPEDDAIRGRVAALTDFQTFLWNEFATKLPRRIYRCLARQDSAQPPASDGR